MSYRTDLHATSPKTSPKTRERRARPRLERLAPGAFLLLFLALGLCLALLNPAVREAPRGASVLNGDFAAAYQRRFEERLALREPALTVWGGLSYGLFGEGRPGVLVGSDGWLFTDEEFARRAETATRADLERVAEVRDTLAERGVGLVIVLLPAKARVYPEVLGRYRLPEYAAERYEDLRAALLERDVLVSAPLPELLEAKSQGEVFLRADTHWTPFGASVAASAVARTARARGLLESLGEAQFVSEPQAVETLRGDLFTFLPLGYLDGRWGPAADRLERFETRQVGGGGNALFGEVSIPVTLVGTSYSAPDWNFAGALKEALGADVLGAAEEGAGPFEPMTQYLSSAAFENAKPELVVWEIPERYFGYRPAEVSP